MSDQGRFPPESPRRADSVRTDSPPLSTVSVPYDFPAARTMELPVIRPIYLRARNARPIRRSGVLGGMSLASAVAMVLVEMSAIEIATREQYALATGLAIAAIVLSVLAVVVGGFGIALRRGLGAAIAGVVLGIIANPLFLLHVLGAVAPG